MKSECLICGTGFVGTCIHQTPELNKLTDKEHAVLLDSFVSASKEYKKLEDENKRLKKENEFLKEWRIGSATTLMSLAHLLKNEYPDEYPKIRNRMIEIGAL